MLLACPNPCDRFSRAYWPEKLSQGVTTVYHLLQNSRELLVWNSGTKQITNWVIGTYIRFSRFWFLTDLWCSKLNETDTNHIPPQWNRISNVTSVYRFSRFQMLISVRKSAHPARNKWYDRYLHRIFFILLLSDRKSTTSILGSFTK